MALLTNINGKFSVSDAGAVTFNNAFTFPTTDGTANYVLKTNGSGTVSWSPDSSPTVYWAANGNDIYNTNSANVGIGTASPEQKLHVEGASITVNRGNDDSSIAFQNSTSGATWRIGRDYSNSEALTFAYSATDYPSLTGNGLISIDTSGNVTIGTTAASNFVLSLRGGVGGFLGWDDSANKTILQAPNTRQLSLRVNSDTFGAGTEALLIDSSGNSTFSGKVNIQGNPPITANANFNDLVITDSGNSGISIFSGNANDGAIYFGDTDANNSGQFKYLHGSNKMTFATSDADRLFIEVNGIYPPTGPTTGTTYYGYNAGLGSAGTSHNTYYGYYAGRANTGTRNVMMGSQTAYSGTSTMNYNVLIGYNVLRSAANTTESNVVIGDSAANNSSGFSSSVVIGQAAGNSMTGNSNTVVGYGAYYGVSTGQSNIIMGYQAANAANMSNAIIIGFRAGYVNQANQIVCIGNEAGRNNIGGVSNVFIGTDAGYGNVSGNSNTYVGSQSGVYQKGLYNTALGHFALYGVSGASNASYNTAIGYDAGNDITTGASNTFLGTFAGNTITTGADNIAIGKESMAAAGTNVTQNIGIGYLTLRLALGSNNIAIGHLASYGGGTSSTSNNVVIGGSAGQQRTEGSNNVIIGTAASFAAGTGGDNTVVGKSSGNRLTSGYNNTLIGADAGSNITSGDNNTCLGALAETPSNSSTNTIVLGNSSVQSLRCQVQTISGLSDKRDKTNIKDSEYGLDLISSLKPVTFKWNQRDGQRKGLKDLGFIAQDLQKVDDEHLSFVSDEDPEKLSASYGRLIPVLVKAIQELKAEIEILKNK